ncbi:cytochrome P450 [Mycena albidolilacea]|uniref:Cytochrome P450 n=1 Tax=Mycena albidolilacea TaxID=1033008 RepID=A0AAD6ZBZ9_9AGAR|nr:cytochrome P450 [Mycena albidolilacea]
MSFKLETVSDQLKPCNTMLRVSLRSQTFLIAGSDTTSKYVCEFIYYSSYLTLIFMDDDPVATSEQVQNLPFLDACIKEGLRILSTIALGLPRVIPERAVVGVPIYTLHSDPDIWGNDPDVYRPERWFDVEKVTVMHKAFNPFSSGPRACVGRNLAALELSLIIATLLRRYYFVLAEPEKPLETREAFIRKPVRCNVGIQRRDV